MFNVKFEKRNGNVVEKNYRGLKQQEVIKRVKQDLMNRADLKNATIYDRCGMYVCSFTK